MGKTTTTKSVVATGVSTNKRPDRIDQPADSSESPLRGEKRETVPADVRQQRVAEAAYRRAECRGFAPGCELDDWLVAELEVDALLVVESQPAEAPASD